VATQNDDYGCLSTWAAFAGLGLGVQAGSTTYILGSPVFANVTVTLPAGTLTILATNASSANLYASHATINGVALPTPFIDHAQLAAPGNNVLEFFMTPTPTVWGQPGTTATLD
jgi:putative alpha-1,2-mannosidase